jgi:hypothetical protein
MENGANRPSSARPSRPAGPLKARPKQWTSNGGRSGQTGSYSAQANYEHYMQLARAEASAGNAIAAENYYQHAEHFLRSMSSDK